MCACIHARAHTYTHTHTHLPIPTDAHTHTRTNTHQEPAAASKTESCPVSPFPNSSKLSGFYSASSAIITSTGSTVCTSCHSHSSLASLVSQKRGLAGKSRRLPVHPEQRANESGNLAASCYKSEGRAWIRWARLLNHVGRLDHVVRAWSWNPYAVPNLLA